MKSGICLLALAALLSHAPATSRATDDPLAAVLRRGGNTVSLELTVRKKKRDSLAHFLELLGGTPPNAFATGFVVGDGLVMTAHHVVSGGFSAHKKRLLGFSQDDQLEVDAYVNGCEATVLKVDVEADLALLGVCGTGKTRGRPAFQAEPGPEERLHVFARPNGDRSVRRGVFSGPYMYRGQQYWAAKIEGRDGFSGSPVYNDRGEIVGVYIAYDSARKLALISPGARAQKLIEAHASGLKP